MVNEDQNTKGFSSVTYIRQGVDWWAQSRRVFKPYKFTIYN